MADQKEIALGIIKNEKGHILVVKRNTAAADAEPKLEWTFPGGEIKKSETSVNAIKREVMEEAGYDIAIEELVDKRQQGANFIYYYAANLGSDKQAEVEDETIAEHKWVTKGQLNKLFTSKINVKVVKYLEA